MATKVFKDGPEIVRSWPSSSNPGKSYFLMRGGDGVVYCTCLAWRFSRERPHSCKHMLAWAECVAAASVVK